MNCYSTKNKSLKVDIGQAILKGLADDGGLFMPERIPKLSSKFLNSMGSQGLDNIAWEISKAFLSGSIPENTLQPLVKEAINFPCPLIKLHKNLHILELFHGPTLAFKDFGARFMSRIMGHLNKGKQELKILVATSGDTGGAVASGFYKVAGIQVVILYPKGGVSKLQEKQLTTNGKNIVALEVEGTFDDCQSMVKRAFVDPDLNEYNLSSANSINLARLIPQTFYYFDAVRQLDNLNDVCFIVPSGNFGNLTAGVLAKLMGLNIDHFIAATNINDVVPHYLRTSDFIPGKSKSTISNAMDVGNPSNFVRLLDLCGSTWNNVCELISGYSISDSETLDVISAIYKTKQYIFDPHTAVGYQAYLKDKQKHPNRNYILLSTAHPSKFIDVVEKQICNKVEIPERLAILQTLVKKSIVIPNEYLEFKKVLYQIF